MSEEVDDIYPALVVKIIDIYKVVINRGSQHGVSKRDRFLVYYVDPEEIIDPETGKSLGNLEIVRGTGSATHIQERMCTIESTRIRIVPRSKVIKKLPTIGAFSGVFGSSAPETETIEEPEREEKLPFEDVEVGDKVKPI